MRGCSVLWVYVDIAQEPIGRCSGGHGKLPERGEQWAREIRASAGLCDCWCNVADFCQVLVAQQFNREFAQVCSSVEQRHTRRASTKFPAVASSTDKGLPTAGLPVPALSDDDDPSLSLIRRRRPLQAPASPKDDCHSPQTSHPHTSNLPHNISSTLKEPHSKAIEPLHPNESQRHSSADLVLSPSLVRCGFGLLLPFYVTLLCTDRPQHSTAPKSMFKLWSTSQSPLGSLKNSTKALETAVSVALGFLCIIRALPMLSQRELNWRSGLAFQALLHSSYTFLLGRLNKESNRITHS